MVWDGLDGVELPLVISGINKGIGLSCNRMQYCLGIYEG